MLWLLPTEVSGFKDLVAVETDIREFDASQKWGGVDN